MTVPDFIPVISRSSHAVPEQGTCIMEMVAFFAGEEHSDHPVCVQSDLNSLAICVNDWVSDDNRNRLAMLIPDFVGSSELETSTLIKRVQQEVFPEYYNWFTDKESRKRHFQFLAACKYTDFEFNAVPNMIKLAAEEADPNPYTNEEWDNFMIEYLEKVMAIVRDMKADLEKEAPKFDLNYAKNHPSQAKVNV